MASQIKTNAKQGSYTITKRGGQINGDLANHLMSK